jgi:hypothetical protein
MNMSSFRLRRFTGIVGGALLLLAVVLPSFSFAGNVKHFYVDDNASGTQNGSSQHPYKTIGQALKHAGNDDEVHVAKGMYEENIEIPYSVKMYGADEDNTIIKAKNKNKPVVVMNHKTTLDKFTIKGGEGVYVSRWSRAAIIHCIVTDSRKDGVRVRNADTSDKFTVSIVKSEIKNSNRTGVFAEKRKMVIMNSVIHDNGSDGADLADGSQAWIDDNNFRDNDGSGLKVALDNSSILVASGNIFRDNKHEGVEVNAYGKTGTMNIRNSKFINNDHYGIARIARVASVPNTVWSGLTQAGNTFTRNAKGDVSPFVHLQ